MKKTTQKLLLCLYQNQQSDQKRVQISHRALDLIHYQLTKSGRKSLLYLLIKKGWVLAIPEQNDCLNLSLTNMGRTALEAKIPALKAIGDQRNKWTAILFCKSIKQDPQFRNLRRVMVKEGAIALTRGMYMFPSIVPTEVDSLVKSLYQKSISMFTIGQWLFGKNPDDLVNLMQIKQVVDTYSSISKEATELLGIIDTENGLNNKRKQQVSLLIDRLHLAFDSDLTATTSYLPDIAILTKPLQLIQQLLVQLYNIS